jgi:hypothetical protein
LKDRLSTGQIYLFTFTSSFKSWLLFSHFKFISYEMHDRHEIAFPPHCILTEFNSFHAFITNFFQIHFNTVLPSAPRSPIYSLLSVFSLCNPVQSVRPYTWNNSRSNVSIFIKFEFGEFFEELSRYLSLHLDRSCVTWASHKDLYVFVCVSRYICSRGKKFRTKIFFSLFFFSYLFISNLNIHSIS